MDLRELIRNVAAEYPKAQPNEIARHAAKLTPPDQIVEFYEAALRPLVQDVLRQDRNIAIHHVVSDRSGVPCVSPKVAGIRSWWQQMLESRVALENGWKVFGDCTYDEVLYCAKERRAHAESVIAQADWYESIARKMKQRRVCAVRELPEQIL